jgi:hypothetical protein
VVLIDAEFGPLPIAEIRQVLRRSPDIVLIGHSGSTPVPPRAVDLCIGPHHYVWWSVPGILLARLTDTDVFVVMV